jgi:hypothetical protein
MSSDDDTQQTQQAPRRALEAWEKPWWERLMRFQDVVDELRDFVRVGAASPVGGTTQYFCKIRAQYNLTVGSSPDEPNPNPRDILILSGMDDFFRCTQTFWEGTVRETLELNSGATAVTWASMKTNGFADRWKSSTTTEKSRLFDNLRRKCQSIQALIAPLLDNFETSRPLQYFMSCEFVGGDLQARRCKVVQDGVKTHVDFLKRLCGRLDPMLSEILDGRDVSTFNWTSSAAPRDGPSGASGVAADLHGMRLLLAGQ